MNDLYLAKDGNWGLADGLLQFSSSEIPTDLYELLQEDPEGAYSEILDWILENKLK